MTDRIGWNGRRIGVAMVLGLLGATVAKAQTQTSLTIYNDGRVLQRLVLPLRVPAGASTHQLAVGAIDASSIFALDPGITITGASYDPAVDEVNALRRAVGRELSFLTRGANNARETVTATVLGVDPERYRLPDGRITFERPGTPVFPAELVPADARLFVALRAERAVPNLGVGFFSGGASWSADYSIVMAKGTARVTGQATIAAGTLRADSAEIQLLAGDVGRAARPMDMFAKEGRVAAAPVAMAQDAAQQQQIGEVHLYSLTGRYPLVPGTQTVAMLFDPVSTPIERTFTVTGRIPYYGGLPQGGEEETEPVQVTYVVKRPLKTAFGDLPIPGGIARIYERDAAGRPQLIGESSLQHTAAGQDLRLAAGTAFDITARRIQTVYQTERQGRRTIATAGYSVTLANARDSAVVVDVLEQRAGEWSVIGSSIPAEKVSSTLTRFRVKVPAQGEANLTYRVRVVW